MVATSVKKQSVSDTERVDMHYDTQNVTLVPLLWQHIVDNLPGGVVVLNAKGIVIYANQAIRDLFNHTLVNTRWSDIISQLMLTQSNQSNHLTLANGKSIDMTTCPLGVHPGQIILMTDVTMAAELQTKIEHHQRLSTMGEMAATLAHQIRTPLAGAFLYANNLAQDALSEDKRTDMTQKLSARLKQIEMQIKNMLLFVKSDALYQEESFTVQELVDVLKSFEQEYASRAKISVKFTEEIANKRLLGEKHIVSGALQNCIENAIQANTSRANIDIRIEKIETQYVCIIIDDDGPGMSEEEAVRAITPFFTTKTQGTGLGLSVVYAVTKRFGGELVLTTNEQGGLRVKLVLPCHKEG